MNLSVAEIRDPDLLAALHAACFDTGWDQAAFRELLTMPGTTAVVALIDSHPVGLMLTRLVLDEAEILTIGTRTDSRRKGAATAMLALEKQRLPDGGTLYLEVSAGNEAAQCFYRTQGFRLTGHRKAYYRDGSDALIMGWQAGT